MQKKAFEQGKWENNYQMGIEEIDRQHAKLFAMARKIVQLHQDDPFSLQSNTFVGVEGVKFLKNYTIQHFATEEAYMKKAGYSAYVEHKREHDKFRDEVIPSLERYLEESNYSQKAVNRLTGVVLTWLVNHVAREDMAIVGRAVSRPRKAVETAKLEETIRNVTVDLFSSVFHGIVPEVVNSSYSGEDFGRAVCYEKSYYSLETRQKMTFRMAAEEKMVFCLAGQLLADAVSRMEELTYFLVEEFCSVLIQNLDPILIRQSHECAQAESRFLTEEQFGEALEARMPEFSSLFETGIGKFALCIDRRAF